MSKTVVVTGTVNLKTGDVYLRASDVVLALYKMGYDNAPAFTAECPGHPDDGELNGPIGETHYCDGSCVRHERHAPHEAAA